MNQREHINVRRNHNGYGVQPDNRSSTFSTGIHPGSSLSSHDLYRQELSDPNTKTTTELTSDGTQSPGMRSAPRSPIVLYEAIAAMGNQYALNRSTASGVRGYDDMMPDVFTFVRQQSGGVSYIGESPLMRTTRSQRNSITQRLTLNSGHTRQSSEYTVSEEPVDVPPLTRSSLRGHNFSDENRDELIEEDSYVMTRQVGYYRQTADHDYSDFDNNESDRMPYPYRPTSSTIEPDIEECQTNEPRLFSSLIPRGVRKMQLGTKPPPGGDILRRHAMLTRIANNCIKIAILTHDLLDATDVAVGLSAMYGDFPNELFPRIDDDLGITERWYDWLACMYSPDQLCIVCGRSACACNSADFTFYTIDNLYLDSQPSVSCRIQEVTENGFVDIGELMRRPPSPLLLLDGYISAQASPVSSTESLNFTDEQTGKTPSRFSVSVKMPKLSNYRTYTYKEQGQKRSSSFADFKPAIKNKTQDKATTKALNAVLFRRNTGGKRGVDKKTKPSIEMKRRSSTERRANNKLVPVKEFTFETALQHDSLCDTRNTFYHSKASPMKGWSIPKTIDSNTEQNRPLRTMSSNRSVSSPCFNASSYDHPKNRRNALEAICVDGRRCEIGEEPTWILPRIPSAKSIGSKYDEEDGRRANGYRIKYSGVQQKLVSHCDSFPEVASSISLRKPSTRNRSFATFTFSVVQNKEVKSDRMISCNVPPLEIVATKAMQPGSRKLIGSGGRQRDGDRFNFAPQPPQSSSQSASGQGLLSCSVSTAIRPIPRAHALQNIAKDMSSARVLGNQISQKKHRK